MRAGLALAAVVVGGFLLASPAHAEPPAPGGCAAFGGNVATLAAALGADFGEAASTVASASPAAFPTVVVQPEQDLLCT